MLIVRVSKQELSGLITISLLHLSKHLGGSRQNYLGVPKSYCFDHIIYLFIGTNHLLCQFPFLFSTGSVLTFT